MRTKHWMGWIVLGSMVACGDDEGQASGTETESDTEADTGDDGETLDTTMTTQVDESSTSTDADSSSGPGTETTEPETTTEDSGPEPQPAEFFVRIENISADSVLPTDLSPGVWFEQTLGSAPLFTLDVADVGDGLVQLAEDGDPSLVADAIAAHPDVLESDVWADPIAPGQMVEFTFTADPGNRLSFATQVARSNDVFLGSGPQGLSLFTNQGLPAAESDVTDSLYLFEVGSEFNQAPGQGLHQAATQPAPDTGMDETGQVSRFVSSTRALPQAAGIVSVDVDTDPKMPGVVIITITNTGEENRGTVAGALSPVLWALHDDTVSLFDAGGAAADVVGLEELAEDGDPAPWLAAIDGAAGIGTAAITDAPLPFGESVVLSVTPDETNRFISLATMVGTSNDAFVATFPSGIALIDENGDHRMNAMIEADFLRLLAVWDAGTEANEVPGVGPNTGAQQLVPDVGAADPDATIRPYSDDTNDLAGENVGGFLTVTIVNGAVAGEFDVTVENTSGGTVYPGVLSPVLYAVHDDTISLFAEGMPASPSLESLAEDADASALLGDLEGTAGVSDVAVGPAALGEGESFSFTVTADATTPFLSIAAMVVPSNDTFVAFSPTGIRLVDDDGTPFTDAEYVVEVAAQLSAWEAGTEANQAGAVGRDQYPRQAADNVGADEGASAVRFASDDPVWAWPEADRIVRVTVGPTGN